MGDNLLHNAGFELDWSEEESHQVLVVPADGSAPYMAERGNIFTPPMWLTWFRHGLPVEHDPTNNDGWSQPEVRDAWITGDPRRVREGQKAILYFTFFRIHDGGFMQQVEVRPGDRLRLDGWAHAWSNHEDPNFPDRFPHPDDPQWSEGEGVGYNHFFALEGQISDDAARNFTFYLGIDPTGGTNPRADSVVWGQGAHIYNAYRPVPPVEAVAEASTVTIFLRSYVLWPFKHCDAYWDDLHLEVVTSAPWMEMTFNPQEPQVDELLTVIVSSNRDYEDVGLEVTDPDGEAVVAGEIPFSPPPDIHQWRWTFTPQMAGNYTIAFTAAGGSERLLETELTVRSAPQEEWGLPRVQYVRTYVLLPPDAGQEWVEAILDSGAWEEERWTIGGSADDAGIGALEDKTVLAVNPAAWGDDLEAFFQQYYPGTRYEAIHASTPEELRRQLEGRG